MGVALAAAAALPASARGVARVVVAPPLVDAGLVPIARAHRAWLEDRLAAAGIPAGSLSLQGPAGSAPVLDAARESSAELVVQADLRERDGRARVALRVIETSSGAVAAATLAEAALPDLGIASERALAALLPRLGVPAAALPETATPSLDELAAVARAMNALDQGELARAWREVEGRLEAMPMTVRESILEQVQRPGAPISDRARILVAAGDGEGAWRVLAPQIARTPEDPSLLLAAAEVAIARRDVDRARSRAAAPAGSSSSPRSRPIASSHSARRGPSPARSRSIPASPEKRRARGAHGSAAGGAAQLRGGAPEPGIRRSGAPRRGRPRAPAHRSGRGRAAAAPRGRDRTDAPRRAARARRARDGARAHRGGGVAARARGRRRSGERGDARRPGRLSVADVARLGIQVCSGLHYAHEQRIVHRDIKTANLFVTREKVVKIMDFGLAKTIEEVRRHSTVIGGTPYYMAPEQAAGEAVDARTDLYALGVTFLRMLTGVFPFQEGDLAYQHRHVAAPDPREVNASLPAAMAELVLALLAKAPDDRPPDAASVGARLQAIRRGALA